MVGYSIKIFYQERIDWFDFLVKRSARRGVVCDEG